MNYIFSDKIASLQPSAIREILKHTADPSVIPFAAGNPAPDAFPIQEVQRITAEILAENPIAALQYSVTEGYPALITVMKDFLKSHNHINSSNPNEVIITSGAQQGIELSCKVLCNEGDAVICEDPSFIGSLNSFRSYHTRLVGVEMEQDGISIEKLEQALKTTPNAKLIYLIPNFQNPSGITMSLAKRKAVYELACRYNVMILEDNPYGDLRFEGEDIPAIKTLDTENRVIYCGSFSKILAPGLRVGYVCAPKPVIAKITVAKQCSDVHTNILSQMICHRFMTQCDIEAHLKRLRQIYAGKCRLMLDGIKANFHPSVAYTKPQGGLFLYCTLPGGADMVKFCTTAVAEHKVAVVPGTAFLADESAGTQSFRLNYSTPSDGQIVRGLEILGELTKKLL